MLYKSHNSQKRKRRLKCQITTKQGLEAKDNRQEKVWAIAAAMCLWRTEVTIHFLGAWGEESEDVLIEARVRDAVLAARDKA